MAEGDFIPIAEIKRFVVDCFVAVNVQKNYAELMADLLIAADYRGHYSHGMNRLEMYLNDIETDTVNANAKPTIIKESPSTGWVNGNNGLGAVVGRFCMDLAIQKAKNVGIGWVCANNSNHYGIAAWHAMYAQEQGLIGISMTNASAAVCPTRAKKATLGANPLCLAAPATNGDSLVIDMSTSAVAMGKIEMQRRKNEPIPAGWALDKDGNVTTDAAEAHKASMMLPLGGSELTSGYKGYGLGAMVEILTGIMSGAHFATQVRRWTLNSSKIAAADLGQVFIVIDPDCFAPGFQDRMTELNDILRNLPPVDEESPVLVPGDLERIHMKKVDEQGGIQYVSDQIRSCDEIANKLNVKKLGSL